MDTCSVGHTEQRKCHEPSGACKRCEKEKKEQAKRHQKECKEQQRRAAQQAAHDKRMKELEEKIMEQQQKIKDEELRIQQEQILAQKRQDLADVIKEAAEARANPTSYFKQLFPAASSSSSSTAQPTTTATGLSTRPTSLTISMEDVLKVVTDLLIERDTQSAIIANLSGHQSAYDVGQSFRVSQSAPPPSISTATTISTPPATPHAPSSTRWAHDILQAVWEKLQDAKATANTAERKREKDIATERAKLKAHRREKREAALKAAKERVQRAWDEVAFPTSQSKSPEDIWVPPLTPHALFSTSQIQRDPGVSGVVQKIFQDAIAAADAAEKHEGIAAEGAKMEAHHREKTVAALKAAKERVQRARDEAASPVSQSKSPEDVWIPSLTPPRALSSISQIQRDPGVSSAVWEKLQDAKATANTAEKHEEIAAEGAKMEAHHREKRVAALKAAKERVQRARDEAASPVSQSKSSEDVWIPSLTPPRALSSISQIQRDPGVSSAVWKNLQDAIAAADAAKKREEEIAAEGVKTEAHHREKRVAALKAANERVKRARDEAAFPISQSKSPEDVWIPSLTPPHTLSSISQIQRDPDVPGAVRKNLQDGIVTADAVKKREEQIAVDGAKVEANRREQKSVAALKAAKERVQRARDEAAKEAARRQRE
jgi:hypothetical protein